MTPSLAVDNTSDLAWLQDFGFEYKYRHLNANAIRLVRLMPERAGDDTLRCELVHQHANVADELSYVTLSYCWGNPRKKKTILLDGLVHHVTLNLWEALRTIRDHHCHGTDEMFWIDALCIDQKNVQERNEQVQKMWSIYANATRTYAWLGPDHTDLEEFLERAQKSFRECSQASHAFRLGGVHKCESRVDKTFDMDDGAGRLLDHDYFTRAWIHQEYAQSKDLHFLCGKLSISRGMLSHHHAQQGLVGGLYFRALDQSVGLEDLYTLLEMYLISCCSDARDRIFAIIGHPAVRRLDPSSSLRVDYSLKPHELLLVVMEWHDKLLLQQDGSWPCSAWNQLAMTFEMARGALDLRNPTAMTYMTHETNFWYFLRGFPDVCRKQLPERLVLASGREIDCTSEAWRYVLYGRIPARPRDHYDSLHGCLSSGTSSATESSEE